MGLRHRSTHPLQDALRRSAICIYILGIWLDDARDVEVWRVQQELHIVVPICVAAAHMQDSFGMIDVPRQYLYTSISEIVCELNQSG